MRSGVWPHSRQSLLPVLGRLRRVLLDAQALALRFARIDPRQELGRFQVRKRQQQVAEVALGIDADRRDAVDAGLFEQRQAQAGLAAAGHADADGVRGEIARVVEQQVLGRRARRRVVFPPEIEHAEFFVVLHGPAPRTRQRCRINLPGGRKVRFPGGGRPGKGEAMKLRATPQAAPCGALIEGVDLREPLAQRAGRCDPGAVAAAPGDRVSRSATAARGHRALRRVDRSVRRRSVLRLGARSSARRAGAPRGRRADADLRRDVALRLELPAEPAGCDRALRRRHSAGRRRHAVRQSVRGVGSVVARR